MTFGKQHVKKKLQYGFGSKVKPQKWIPRFIIPQLKADLN